MDEDKARKGYWVGTTVNGKKYRYFRTDIERIHFTLSGKYIPIWHKVRALAIVLGWSYHKTLFTIVNLYLKDRPDLEEI